MSAFDGTPVTGYEQSVLPAQAIHTNGYKASLIVNTGPCLLIGFSVFNSNVAAQFIQVFDGTAVPASGANPAAVFAVPTVANLGVYYGTVGRPFFNGCVIVNSSTGPTFTAGAADCYIDAQYVAL